MKFIGIISVVTLLVAATVAPVVQGHDADCSSTTTTKCRTKTITKTTSEGSCHEHTTTVTKSCSPSSSSSSSSSSDCSKTCATDSVCTVYTETVKHGKTTVTDYPHPTCYACHRKERCHSVCVEYATVVIQKGRTPDCEDLACINCIESANECGGREDGIIQVPPPVVGPAKRFAQKGALQAIPRYIQPVPCQDCYENPCKKTTTEVCLKWKTQTKCLKEVHGKCVKTGCADPIPL